MKLHDNDICAMRQLQEQHDHLLERWKDAPAYSQDVANLHVMFKAWDSRVGKLVADGLFKRILAAHDSGVMVGGEGQPQKLWLWKNFVDGRPEYWAFDNPYPINLTDGDPQTLGEPCGYAIFKPSRNGRPDVPDDKVIAAIKHVLGVAVDAELDLMPWCQSLVAALKQLSFAAQTTGGTAGPDPELQAAIAQAEQAMSMRGLMTTAGVQASAVAQPENDLG